ncbi:MAG: CdaR family protein [Chloroflexota bacterium]
MNRAARFLVHNWPLKLGAVILATLLYSGLVLSENTRTFTGSVPIEEVNQPSSVILLTNLPDVVRIRYFAPNDGIRLDSSSFRATVDLSAVDPTAGRVSVAVRVEAIDPRIQILDVEPSRINIQVDEVIRREVPIEVDTGDIPPGLDVREAQLSLGSATVVGPSSVVKRAARAVARVRIDPSGIDIDRDVDLIVLDELGEPLSQVDVEPSSVRVTIAVFTDRQTRSLAVNPIYTGTPAAGFEVAAVTVEPVIVGVEGDADQLAALTRLDTQPISISGISSDLDRTVALSLPAGILALGVDEVRVTVTLRAVTATRTFSAGLVVAGANSSLTYDLSSDRVLVTIGGSVADLDRLTASTFTVRIDVSGLGPGVHEVPLTPNLAAGLTLVAVAPDTVSVTIASPPPTGSPVPSPVP